MADNRHNHLAKRPVPIPAEIVEGLPTPAESSRSGLIRDLVKRHLDRRDLEHLTTQQLRIIQARQQETETAMRRLAMESAHEENMEMIRQQGLVAQEEAKAMKELLAVIYQTNQATMERREKYAHELTMARERRQEEREREQDRFQHEIEMLEFRAKLEASPEIKQQIQDQIDLLRGKVTQIEIIKAIPDDDDREAVWREWKRTGGFTKG